MRTSLLLVVIAAGLATTGECRAQEAVPALRDTSVTIGGHAVRARTARLSERRAGEPVVVFEAGAINSLEVWGSVLGAVAAHAPLIAYDRAGLGRSEWDGETPTPRHVATRLRALLTALDAPPPYLLVGYSLGGTLVRYFAGYHPEEVAGIVYVDPGPILTQTKAEQLLPFEAIGAGRAGYDAYWSFFASLYAGRPPAVRAEFEAFRELTEREMEERDIRPAPAVPVVVLVAAKPYPPFGELPFDQAAYFQADLAHRIRLLERWALASGNGTLVVANSTTHAVPREDPELIVWAVMRVLAAIGR